MFSITKSFKFEAAHRLHNMPIGHQCRNIHGHSYVVKVTVSVEHLESDMVLDFGKLKAFQLYLDDQYDHAIILNPNDVTIINFVQEMGFKNKIMNCEPTAENMAYDFVQVVYNILKEFNINSANIKVEVFETVTSSATYESKF